MITQSELKQLLSYDQETGIFTNLTNRAPTIKAGATAGHISKSGYAIIKINNKTYKAHRLAWLYVYGSFPKEQIDHINGIKYDNRLCNLREATNKQNQQNRLNPKSNNNSGFLGVSYRKDCNRWRATLLINGKNKSLGDYETPEEASEVYIKAKRQHHEFFSF